MNRYRIILESETVLADDELNDHIRIKLNGCNVCDCNCQVCYENTDFKVVEAINLEGIKDDPGQHQFYCTTHKYGWSIDEDGLNLGCPECNEL